MGDGIIMVDELRRWPTRIACFRNGACHLTIDNGLGDTEALHAFAQRVGLKRAWFQGGSTPHYDLSRSRRERALELGAVFVPGKEQARVRIAARRLDPLHPTGRCTCCGEGSCDWCQRTDERSTPDDSVL